MLSQYLQSNERLQVDFHKNGTKRSLIKKQKMYNILRNVFLKIFIKNITLLFNINININITLLNKIFNF